MKTHRANLFFRYRLFFVLSIFSFFFLLPLSVHAEENSQNTVLRVAFPETPGFSETAPDGTPTGLIVDYLNEIAKYTNWEYEYIPVSSDDLLDHFLAGDFDLMGSTYYSADFEPYFAYPDYNCGYVKCFLTTDDTNMDLKSYNLSSMNGKKIGVYERATENIKRLEQFLSQKDLDCEIVLLSHEETNTNDLLFSNVTDGKVDLILSSGIIPNEHARILTSFDSQPHFIVTQPDSREILDELNMALEKILDSNPAFAEECYNANFSSISTHYAPLTKQEKDYIREKGTVTVAVTQEMHPFFCLNNEHTHDGLLPDFLKRISEFTGLSFSYVYADSYEDAISLVQNKEADMLGYFIGSGQDAAEANLVLCQKYGSLSNVILRNKTVNYPSGGLTAAVLSGESLPDSLGASEVTYYPSVSDMMAAVNNGKADFAYGISIYLEQEMQKHHFNNLIPVTLTGDVSSISFALSKPADTTLLPILNKAVNQISVEDKKTLLEQNMISIGIQHVSLSELIYSNPIFFIFLITFILLIFVAAVIIVARTRVKSAVILGNFERAQAESRAKSDFLSRMSHEVRTPMNAIMGLTDLTGMIEDLPESARKNLAEIQTSSRYLLDLINDILDMSRIENGMMTLNNEPFCLDDMLEDFTSMIEPEAKRHGLSFSSDFKLSRKVLEGDGLRIRQVLMNLLSNAFKFTPPGGSVSLEVSETSSDSGHAVFLFRVADTGCGIEPQYQKKIFQAFEQVGSNFSKSQGTGLGLPISNSILALMGSSLSLESEPQKGSVFSFSLRLPLGVLPEKPQSTPPEKVSEDLSGMRILLAEDNDLNAKIAAALLEKRGAQVDRATDGAEALDLFISSAPGTYGAILMDILMPNMNGLDATKNIRASKHPDSLSVPIIAMTASSFQEDIDAAREAGMNAFLGKPLELHLLYETLAQLRSC